MTDQEPLLPKHKPVPNRVIYILPRRVKLAVSIHRRLGKMIAIPSSTSLTNTKETMADCVSPTKTMDSTTSIFVVPAPLEIESVSPSNKMDLTTSTSAVQSPLKIEAAPPAKTMGLTTITLEMTSPLEIETAHSVKTMDSTTSTLVVPSSLDTENASPAMTTDSMPETSFIAPKSAPEIDRPSLTNITPELLIQILSYVPSDSYLPLIQSCHGMRSFFTENVTNIVNASIRTRFPYEASLLGTVKKTDTDESKEWLAPTISSIRESEDEHLDWKRHRCSICRGKWMSMGGSRVGPLPSHSILPPSPDCTHCFIPLTLTTGGPLYLYFLEKHNGDIRYRAECTTASLNEYREHRKRERWTLSPPEREEEFLSDYFRSKFTATIALYCIRGVVVRLDELAEEGMEMWNFVPGFRARVEEWIGDCVERMKNRYDKVGFCGMGKKKLLFGEVQGEKKKKLKKGWKGDRERLALRWYYGESGVLKCPELDKDRLGMEKPVEKGAKCKFTGLRKKVKKFKSVGSGVIDGLVVVAGNAMIPFKCFGDFQVLP